MEGHEKATQGWNWRGPGSGHGTRLEHSSGKSWNSLPPQHLGATVSDLRYIQGPQVSWMTPMTGVNLRPLQHTWQETQQTEYRQLAD